MALVWIEREGPRVSCVPKAALRPRVFQFGALSLPIRTLFVIPSIIWVCRRRGRRPEACLHQMEKTAGEFDLNPLSASLPL